MSEFAKSTKRKLTNIREELLKLFPDRELIRMRHPLENCVEGETGNLGEIDLGPEFREDLEYFQAKVFNETPVKQIWSRKITGKILAFLLQEYVQYLNKQGGRIDFSAAWDFFMESELDHIFNECMRQADLQLKRHTWHKEDENADQVFSELQKEGLLDDQESSNLPMKQEDVILVVD